jgi:3',5'-cyclic AMP phosphodiesterase CpdA
LSDLHAVELGQRRTQDGTEVKDDATKRLLLLASNMHPNYLVVTGDITDSGSAAEWNHAQALLSAVPRDIRVILAPGNHDFSLAFESSSERTANDYEPTTHSRVPRFLALQSALFGDVRTSHDEKVSDIVRSAPPLPDATERLRAANELASCVDVTAAMYTEPGHHAQARAAATDACEKKLGSRLEPINMQARWQRYWNAASQDVFPLYYIDETRRVAFISMASSTQGDTEIGTNAIGYMDSKQYSNLGKLLKAVPPTITSFVFLYHHPITALDAEATVTADLSSLFALQDSVLWANALLRHDIKQANNIRESIESELAKRPAARAFFLFGHRHRQTLGTLRNISFVEAPNAYADYPGVYILRADESVPLWCALGGSAHMAIVK